MTRKCEIVNIYYNGLNEKLFTVEYADTGNFADISLEYLKQAIIDYELAVTNATLTSDNRLYIKRSFRDTAYVPYGLQLVSQLDKDMIASSKLNITIGSTKNEQIKKIKQKIDLLGIKPKILYNKDFYALNLEKHIIILTDKQRIQAPINCSYMFGSDNIRLNIKNLTIKGVDTSHIRTVESIFKNAYISKLDISEIDTSNIDCMAYMFAGAILKNVDLSNLNTYNTKDMRCMFAGANLNNVNISKLNTHSAKDMRYMFAEANLYRVKIGTLDLSNINNHNCLRGMFSSTRFRESKIMCIRFPDKLSEINKKVWLKVMFGENIGNVNIINIL